MKRTLPLLALAFLAGCTPQRLPSAYDIVARPFGPDGQTFCQRYAYESGRNRYEFQSRVMGQAFAASNANLTAEVAYERCLAERGERR